MKNIRIGFGMDVHRLCYGLPFVLGGVAIPFQKGAEGHSDADVLIHAICDALLGAVNERDIGFHFPDTDADFKNINSRILLQKTMQIVREKEFDVGNIDCTIALQEPKIAGFIPKMQQTLSETMQINAEDISIKATTTEKLGFEGRGEGVTAHAVALLYSTKKTS